MVRTKITMLAVVLSLTGFAALAASGCGDDTVDSDDSAALTDQFMQEFPDATEEQQQCVEDAFASFSDETMAEFQEVGEGGSSADTSPETQEAAQELAACVAK